MSQKSAAGVVSDVSSLVERSAVVRSVLPSNAPPEFVQAVRSGVAARVLVDIISGTLGNDHQLTEAVIEYINISMGVLCHFTTVDPDDVSACANAVLEKIQAMTSEHIVSSDVGTPSIVQRGPATPQ